jgi:hypothetical protein
MRKFVFTLCADISAEFDNVTLMKISFFLLSLTLFLLACGPTPPTEAEIRARYLGTYCDGWKYRLELTDSTYMNRSVEKGTFQNIIYLSCNGTYSFVMEEGQWIIRFEKDERPQTTLESCEQTVVLWSKETGYAGGDDITTLVAPLDGKTLSKGSCEE